MRSLTLALCALPAIALSLASTARACPDCASSVAARAAVFGDPASFAYAAFTIAPFVVLGAVTALLHRIDASPPSAGGER